MQSKDEFNRSGEAATRAVRSELSSIASEMGGLDHPGLEEMPGFRENAPEGDCGQRDDNDNQGYLRPSEGEWQSRDFGPEDNAADTDHGCSGFVRF